MLSKDARLRLAVAHAIRWEEIVEAAFFGRGTPLGGPPIPKVGPFYDEGLARVWAYDPADSKRLVQETGVGGGPSRTLLPTARHGMHESTAGIVRRHPGEIGIEVEPNPPDWLTRATSGNRGQYEARVRGQAADNNDPDGSSSCSDGRPPLDDARGHRPPTPRIHEPLARGRAGFDAAERRAIHAEAQKVAAVEAPMAGLCRRS